MHQNHRQKWKWDLHDILHSGNERSAAWPNDNWETQANTEQHIMLREWLWTQRRRKIAAIGPGLCNPGTSIVEDGGHGGAKKPKIGATLIYREGLTPAERELELSEEIVSYNKFYNTGF